MESTDQVNCANVICLIIQEIDSLNDSDENFGKNAHDVPNLYN